jgi:hypothetical protein
MAISPNDAFTSGQILTAQECNNFPFGVVGLVERTSGSVTVTTTLADLTGMSVTFTALANRVYKFTCFAAGQKLTNAGWTSIVLANSANTIYSTIYATTTADQYFNGSFSVYVSGLTAGSQTFKLRSQSSINTSSFFAVAGSPLQLIVEDMGPI